MGNGVSVVGHRSSAAADESKATSTNNTSKNNKSGGDIGYGNEFVSPRRSAFKPGNFKRVVHSVERMLGILQFAPAAIITMNKDEVILDANKAAHTLLGWEEGELVGQKCEVMIPEGPLREAHRRGVQRFIATRTPHSMGKPMPTHALRKDGTTVPVELTLSFFVVNGELSFTGFMTDITEKTKAQKLAEEATARNKHILDIAADGILAFEDGVVVTANPSSKRIFGFKEDEDISGMYLNDFFPNLPQIDTIIDTTTEAEAIHCGGHMFPVEIAASKLNLSNKSLYTILFRDITERKIAERRIAEEKQRSEELLLNILPATIAEQLKAMDLARWCSPEETSAASASSTTSSYSKPIAETYESVSILFSDIVGFTAMSSSMQASEIVGMLNELFSAFDDNCAKYRMEKIKTVGDAYLAVAGFPWLGGDSSQHAADAIKYAFKMLDIIKEYNARNGTSLQMRIGIHSGQVRAGVIGKIKFSFDLWSDSVNVASRMESTGTPMRIQVSRDTMELAKHEFEFESQGLKNIKGKGSMETFLVVGPRVQQQQQQSNDYEGIQPGSA